MLEILRKRKRNSEISKEEFIQDVNVLFAELKHSYGGYDYFGEDAFENVKQNILDKIEEGYEFEQAVQDMIGEFRSFIYDGHFAVDGQIIMPPKKTIKKTFDYAVRMFEVEEIPVFDIKKFTYDNEDERRQLEEFSKCGKNYQNEPCLIFDLRQNAGGSDSYMWQFLTDLNGEEPDAPMDFRQVNSDTFIEWLKLNGFSAAEEMTPGIEEYKSEGKMIEKEQRIYVLIDRGTASSAESALYSLKTMTGTVLLGENSWGCGFCGNCMSIYLPNSGICVYYGTGRVLYKGAQNIDEMGGIAPDIYGEFEIQDVVEMWKRENGCK